MIIDVYNYVRNGCTNTAQKIWYIGITKCIFIVQLSGRSFIKIEVPQKMEVAKRKKPIRRKASG